MISFAKKIFALDYRSLALLRIAVGLTLIFDLAQRAGSLFAHYTDGGVLPRSELFRLWNENAFASVYHINGSPLFAGILFLVAGIFGVMLVVGWRTRLATIVSFILLISLHNRNPLVLQGGDVALRVILFWMMFLPLARSMSIDAILGRVPKAVPESQYVSWAGAAYLIQFLLVWTMSGFLKNGAPWADTHTAVGMALSLEMFTTGFGQWMKNLKLFLPYLTIGTLAVERFAFLLFFVPSKSLWPRFYGVLLFALLVIGFNLSFRLGLFGMIMISISLGLLPRVFWDKIVYPIGRAIARKSLPGVTIFYDGDCGFCFRTVQALKKILFLHPDTRIAVATEDEAAEALMIRANSWVVRDNRGQDHFGFRAFAALAQSSFVWRFPVPVLLFRPIAAIGEYVYRLVSHNRPLVCSPADSGRDDNRPRPGRDVFVAGMLVLVVLWNIHTFPGSRIQKFPPIFEKLLLIFRLDQKWNMFAPYPTTEDGFYVIPGSLRDGSSVDLYTGGPVSYEKPAHMAWTYKDQRWQKYLMNLWLQSFEAYRLGYGQYICRQWNQENPFEKQVVDFSILYVLEETDMNTLKEGPLRPITIWQHSCFK